MNERDKVRREIDDAVSQLEALVQTEGESKSRGVLVKRTRFLVERLARLEELKAKAR